MKVGSGLALRNVSSTVDPNKEKWNAGRRRALQRSGALAYGWQDITTDRTVAAGGLSQLHAEFNANTWSGRLEGGYRFVVPSFGGLGVTPYAAGQFTTFDLPAYAESVITGTPTFALSYASKSVTDTRSELGFRSDKSFAMQDGVLTLRSRFAWAHGYNPDRSIGATFQSLPGASFVVNGAAQASDSALTTASVEMKWMNRWSAGATFEGEFRTSPTPTPARAWCGTFGEPGGQLFRLWPQPGPQAMAAFALL